MFVLPYILLVLIVAADANLFDGDTTLTEEEKLVGIQIESDLSNRYEKHTFLSTANDNGSGLFWTVDVGAQEIYFALAVRAIGWVGLGVSEAGGMIGSDIMLFESSSPDTVIDSYVVEDKGAGPLVDDCQDWTLMNTTILTDEGWMIIEVKRAFDTFDSQDIPIVNDEELWSAPTRIIAAWGDGQMVSYHGQNKARASIRLFSDVDESVDDGVELREELESQADGYFEVGEVDYVIPAEETTYHDICATYDDLFDKESQDDDGVAMIGAAPFFSEDTEQYLKHFHHFTVYVAESCESSFPRTMVYLWAPGSKGLGMPNNVGLPLFHKQQAMAIHMEIHFDNPTFKENMVVSGGVRFYYMNDQLENKAGILELGDPILSLNGDKINDGLTKYQFTCSGDCSRTFASGSNNNGVTVFNEFLHMHQTGVRMTNEVVRGDNVVHSANVDVYDFPQQGGFHTPQSSYNLLPGDSFRTTCYYRDGDRFGIDSDAEMCIAYVMYYPVLEMLGFTWTCPYAGDTNGGQVLDLIGCSPELEISDIDDVSLGRIFGTSNDQCDATESPSKAPITLSPTISKPPSPEIMTCSFCKDGLTVEPSLEIPGADGASCGDVNSYAAFFIEDSIQCTEVKGAEVACCPSKAEIPCNFCKDGLTVDFSAVVPGDDGFTCGDLVSFSVSLEDISDTCTEVKLAEFICCPSVDTKDEGVSSKSPTTDASDPPTQVIDASGGLLIKSSIVYMLSVTTMSLILW